MHSIKQALTSALLVAGAASVAQSATISFGGVAAGDGSVLSGSLSGKYATPAGDSTDYLSVAYPKQAGVETFEASISRRLSSLANPTITLLHLHRFPSPALSV